MTMLNNWLNINYNYFFSNIYRGWSSNFPGPPYLRGIADRIWTGEKVFLKKKNVFVLFFELNY